MPVAELGMHNVKKLIVIVSRGPPDGWSWVGSRWSLVAGRSPWVSGQLCFFYILRATVRCSLFSIAILNLCGPESMK